MEIGAVKQAFNNELILLKKKLNQAKTQIIHKLTRKAKQLTEKKGPDALQEKFKKKAENAVKEVLLLKKIKARDIGRFIVTHTGKLQDFLNKSQVDNDKACARILLHKVMQQKYNFIRNRFSNIPIRDLFMSRNERLKLKKEEKLKKKEKRDRKNAKAKNNIVNAEGDWDVEDVDKKENKGSNAKEMEESGDEQDMSDEEDQEADSKQSQEDQDMPDEDEIAPSEQSELDSEKEGSINEGSVEDGSGSGFKISFKGQNGGSNNEIEASDDQSEEDETVNVVRPVLKKNKKISDNAGVKKPVVITNEIKLIDKSSKLIKKVENKLKFTENTSKIKSKKKQKDNTKNKNLQDKILNKKFKKDSDDTPELEQKVVDPFFITATGENYMSVVEPRQPDEIKEVHKQGNRQLRRAVMFGHVPRSKPRQQRQEDNRFDKQDSYGKRTSQQNGNPRNNNKFNNRDDNNGSNNRFDGKRKPRFNDRRIQEESKPEKLHPSWEAKKKQSGILPFQGKKIVFDES